MRMPPEPLNREEVFALLAAPSGRYPTGARNRALLAFLYGGGLRCAEALALEVRDVDHARATARIRHGKGDRDRLVVVGEMAIRCLEAWECFRPEASPFVFCTLDGGPLSSRYVRKMTERMGKRAGIEKRCHPHGLRHTHASELVEEGFDLALVRDQLGHKSIATTDKYIARIAPERRIRLLGERRMASKDPEGPGPEVPW